MRPICLKCEHKIPLSWFIFSAQWTKYRCVKCSTLHEWSSKRQWIGGLGAVSAVICFSLLETVFSSYWLSALLVSTGFLVLLPLIPGQHRLALFDNKHNQVLKEDADNKSSTS
jgi:hypothetical protein